MTRNSFIMVLITNSHFSHATDRNIVCNTMKRGMRACAPYERCLAEFSAAPIGPEMRTILHHKHWSLLVSNRQGLGALALSAAVVSGRGAYFNTK